MTAHRKSEQTIDLDAELTDVWRMLTDPDALTGWLGREVDLDLRPGGTGVVVDPDGSSRDVLVTDVDEPRRIAWHWWHERGHLSSVEITVVPTSTGTRVRVVEVLDPSTIAPRPAARAGTRAGTRAGATAGGRPMALDMAATVADGWTARLDRLRVMATSGSLSLVR